VGGVVWIIKFSDRLNTRRRCTFFTPCLNAWACALKCKMRLRSVDLRLEIGDCEWIVVSGEWRVESAEWGEWGSGEW
jgi:hypothetical protein